MKQSFIVGSLLVLSVIATGCRSVDPDRYPTPKEWHDEHQEDGHGSNGEDANHKAGHVSWHGVRMEVPSDLPRPRWQQKISPVWWFKNNADPRPPDDYRPGKKTRIMTWYLRNPFHNFDYYVIGVADHETVRKGKYPEDVLNPHGGWNLAVTAYKRLRLPLVSYDRHGITFYFGWRESGNFGVKINLKKKTNPEGEAAACPINRDSSVS